MWHGPSTCRLCLCFWEGLLSFLFLSFTQFISWVNATTILIL